MNGDMWEVRGNWSRRVVIPIRLGTMTTSSNQPLVSMVKNKTVMDVILHVPVGMTEVQVNGVTHFFRKSHYPNSVSGLRGVSPEGSEYKRWLRLHRELAPNQRPPYTGKWKVMIPKGLGTMICGELLHSDKGVAALRLKEWCSDNQYPY